MRAVLRPCSEHGVRILTNMGAANPLAAAAQIRAIADELGLPHLKVAAITGDDVLELVTSGDYLDDTGAPVTQLQERLLSANAYLGAQPLVDALAQGAHVIVTGRVADPALVLAPLIHEFGWAMDDWHKLGPRHPGRPPARMRGPGQRRLFCRPWLQGCEQPGAPRFSRSAKLARTAAWSLPRWPAPAAA